MVDWLAQNPGRFRGRTLVPGCGLGHDVRALVMSGAEEVVGMDLSPSAIE